MTNRNFREYYAAWWLLCLLCAAVAVIFAAFFIVRFRAALLLAAALTAACIFLAYKQLVVIRRMHTAAKKQDIYGSPADLVETVTASFDGLRSCTTEILAMRTDMIRQQDSKSRLDALQAQINPHFLYNTLECIRGQAMISHDMSIVNMAGTLSSLFQYSINRTGGTGTLHSELKNIRQYMQIQNFRFDGRIRMQIFDDSVMDARRIIMPRMILQPIVENAVIHGLQSKEEGGIIKVCVAETDRSLMIDVIDDGIGMSEETLEKLNFQAVPGENGERHHGVGIRNICDRLNLIYGNDCSLRVYSAPGAGTQVSLVLPRIEVSDDIKNMCSAE